MLDLSALMDALNREGPPSRPERSNIVLAKHGEGRATVDLLWCFHGGHVFARLETRGVKPFECEQHGLPRIVSRAAPADPELLVESGSSYGDPPHHHVDPPSAGG